MNLPLKNNSLNCQNRYLNLPKLVFGLNFYIYFQWVCVWIESSKKKKIKLEILLNRCLVIFFNTNLNWIVFGWKSTIEWFHKLDLPGLNLLRHNFQKFKCNHEWMSVHHLLSPVNVNHLHGHHVHVHQSQSVPGLEPSASFISENYDSPGKSCESGRSHRQADRCADLKKSSW